MDNGLDIYCQDLNAGMALIDALKIKLTLKEKVNA